MLASVVGAVVFGLYIGYLALTNDSFPSQQKPFASYASVTSATFNGTEYAFNLTWLNASAIPYQAQLNSPVSDAANTVVCSTELKTVTSGQNIFLPFTIRPRSPTLQNVNLYIGVHPVHGGSAFTIVYNVSSVSASNDPITPSNIACTQPQGA